MSRSFLVPILLPADPTAPLEASTKQYVDNAVGFTFTQDATPTATSPGQTWFNTATGASYVWVDDGTSTQWVQFAPGAGGGGSGKLHGAVAYAQVTTSQGSIGASQVDIAGLSVSWTADPTRTYRTVVRLMPSSTVSNDDFAARITDAAGNQKQMWLDPVLDSMTSSGVEFSLVEFGLSGVITRKVRASRSAGTGTVTCYADPTAPAFILVEDITPETSGGGVGGPVIVRLHRFTEGQRNLTGGVEVTLAQFTRQDLDPLAAYKVTTFIRAARIATQISFIWKWPNNASIAGMEWWWSATGGFTSMSAEVIQSGAAMNLGAMKLNCTPSAGVELYMDTASTVMIEKVADNYAGILGGN